MGRRKGPKHHLNNVQISDMAYEILIKKKASKAEAIHRVLDRILFNYLNSEIGQLQETIEKQAKIIEFYYNRIKDLEQTKLIQ